MSIDKSGRCFSHSKVKINPTESWKSTGLGTTFQHLKQDQVLCSALYCYFPLLSLSFFPRRFFLLYLLQLFTAKTFFFNLSGSQAPMSPSLPTAEQILMEMKQERTLCRGNPQQRYSGLGGFSSQRCRADTTVYCYLGQMEALQSQELPDRLCHFQPLAQ